jgi:hypothetical protein
MLPTVDARYTTMQLLVEMGVSEFSLPSQAGLKQWSFLFLPPK